MVLEIIPDNIYVPGYALDVSGNLRVALDGDYLTTLPIQVERTARLPLELPAGFHTLTLSLEAGNFRPSDRGGDDTRWLSFAVSSLNLVTRLEP